MDEAVLGKRAGDKVLKYLQSWNDQDPYSELEEHLSLGVDGFFTDFPQTAANYFKYRAKTAS